MCFFFFCTQLQAFFLIVDDLMDEAPERRGRPCWYRVDGVGGIAMNDSILLENGIYFILKKYFADKPYYVNLLEIFHDVRPPTFMSIRYATGCQRITIII